MADNRMRVWFALFVLAVFCLGGAAGIFIGARLDRPERPWWRGAAAGRGPDAGIRGGPPAGPPRGIMLDRLARQLDLDAAQREQVRAVLEASRERLATLQRDARDRYQSERQTLHDEIRAILTPEQRERFDRALERGPRGTGRGR